MLRIAWLYVALAVVQAAGPARQNQDSANDINALLTAYEKRDPSLPPDPEALGKIARLVMARTAGSQLFRVWSEECASTFVTDKAACDTKLRGVLNDTAKPVAMRVGAGAVLIKHGDAKASNAVLSLLNNLRPSDLIPLVPIVRQLPHDRVEPVLLTLLAARQPPTARTLLLTMAAWLALNVYWPLDWPLDPRVLALVTLVPQAVTVAVAALALRQPAPQPAAAGL